MESLRSLNPLLVDRNGETNADFNYLRPRSPMNPPGPPGGQSQPGAASAPSSSVSLSAAGLAQEVLNTYVETGGHLMELVFANERSAQSMLNAKFPAGPGRYRQPATIRSWLAISDFQAFKDNGWIEQDMSPQLTQSQFMDNFADTYGQIIVGQAEETLVHYGVQHLRKASTEVWPRGPNRLLRVVQNGRWKKSEEQQAQRLPTNGYHDVIHNARDGILILLRQSSAWEAAQSESPQPLAPMLQYGAGQSGNPIPDVKHEDAVHFEKLWGTDQIWYAEWLWQRHFSNPDSRRYTEMAPTIQPIKSTSAVKRKDIRFIIVPNVGMRNEPADSQMLRVAAKCLSSVKDDMQAQLYGEFGSFFPAGSWCTNALLSLHPNDYVANFLARHKNEGRGLGRKTIVGVHIVRLSAQSTGNNIVPTLMWQFADFKESDVECAEAWGKTPAGQPLLLRVSPGAGAPRSKKGKEPEIAPSVPLYCYPEAMRRWQMKAFVGVPVNKPEASNRGSDPDRMDIDEIPPGQTGQEPADGSASAEMSVDDFSRYVDEQRAGSGPARPGRVPGPAPAAVPQFQPPARPAAGSGRSNDPLQIAGILHTSTTATPTPQPNRSHFNET